MKKIIFSVVFLLIGFCSAAGIAQAQTAINPEETAALNQKLEEMKADLIQLRAQVVAQTPTAPKNPEVLSSEELEILSQSLIGLKNTLLVLEIRLQNNDPSVTNANKDAVYLHLANIRTSLVALSSTLLTLSPSEPKTKSLAAKPLPTVTQEPSSESLGESSVFPEMERVVPAAAATESILSINKFSISLLIGLIALIAVIWIWKRNTKEEEVIPISPTSRIDYIDSE